MLHLLRPVAATVDTVVARPVVDPVTAAAAHQPEPLQPGGWGWLRRRLRLRPLGRAGLTDAGMTTAEYAVGTLAACAFAGVLYVVVRSGAVHSLLQSVITKALNLAP
jgi:hypothetical protein